MQILELSINEIKPYPKNAKEHKESQIKKIADSIKEFGFNQPIVIDKDNVIIVGHGRYIAALFLGMETVPTLTLDLDEEHAKAYRLADNKLNESEWEMDIVIEELKGLSLEMIDLTGFDADLLIENNLDKEYVKKSLNEIFIVSPMSVLDTRSAVWQDRKEKWRNVGIKSYCSRENMKTSGSLSGTMPNYYNIKNKIDKKLGRITTREEFESKYINEYLEKSILKYTNTGGILSIFDPVLCEIMYYWFCIPEGKILDPFAGGSVRGIVANHKGYKYTGVDLSDEQIKQNIINAKEIIPDKVPEWFIGNSIDIDKIVKDNDFDFIFSCPPYFDLEVYGNKEGELSNMSLEEFYKNYRLIIKKTVDKLKENRFACFVIGEVRDKKRNGQFINFIGETINAFIEAGMSYYNEMILLSMWGSVPIRMLRQFTSTRKIGKVHQNVLVFYKGDIKKIKEIFSDKIKIPSNDMENQSSD